MQNPINIGYFTTTHIQNLKNNRDKYYMMTIGLILVMQVFLMSMITIDMVCHIRKYKIKKLRSFQKMKRENLIKNIHLLYSQK